MRNRESSRRIELLRFPLIVGVVFIHSYDTNPTLAGAQIGIAHTDYVTDFVRSLISQGIACTAVPLLFLISGYLFFAGRPLTTVSFVAKLKSRSLTLLLPFLVWNIATLFVLVIAQAAPVTQGFFSGNNAAIANFTSWDFFTAIWGVGRPPISYQFWFIRDLMLLVLFARVIEFLNRSAPTIYLFILIACWLTHVWPVYAPSVEAMLFFSIGACLASRGWSLFEADKYGSLAAIVYVPLVVTDVYMAGSNVSPYLHGFGIAIGVIAILSLTRIVVQQKKCGRVLISLGSTSFFLFAAHEPLLTAVRKIAYKIANPESTYFVLALYFLIPMCVIVGLVVTHRALSSIAPAFLGIVTGERWRQRR